MDMIEGEPLRRALSRTRRRFDIGGVVVVWFWALGIAAWVVCLIWLYRQIPTH